MGVVIQEFESVAVDPPADPAPAAAPARAATIDPDELRMALRREDERRARLVAN